jgi:putative flippase GtrA
VSSLAATVVDGTAYQVVLFFVPSYTLAAFVGAVLGAVTNFSLNRYWAFPRTSKKLGYQAGEYAIASGATYLGLQASLYLLIEVVGIASRIAWLPGKVIAWLLVSYPMQRFFVFAERRRKAAR